MKWAWFSLCLLCHEALADLPDAIQQALATTQLPASAMSVLVVPADDLYATPLLYHQADVARPAASTMKLLVSYAALSLLGADYRWQTPVYYDGFIQAGTLHGNLYFKGQGDPSFNDEDLFHLLTLVQAAGIDTIDGNFIIDQSAFAQDTTPPLVDDEPQRGYHARPSAFAIDANALSFVFNSTANQVSVNLQPSLSTLTVDNALRVGGGDCQQWRAHLQYQIAPLGVVHFTGDMPPYCQNKSLTLQALEPLAFYTDLLTTQWQALGGRLRGTVQWGGVASTAHWLTSHESPPLSVVLMSMNKWSDNFMARQLLLDLAAQQSVTPVSVAQGIARIRDHLHSLGLDVLSLTLENGSGLSRHETLTAAMLARLLQLAYASPLAEPFIASLPILGRDGTLQNRLSGTALAGEGQLKTGSLHAVATLAGYLRAQSGKRYVVVILIADEHANSVVQDALLRWVYQH